MKLIAEIKIFSKEDRKTVAGMDNVVKLVADALNQVAYRDDTQIVDCQCRKFYSEQPRTVIIIKQIGKENEHE